ncbi:hypothetical protein OUZ56_032794 [Daphnia magna]|uniref:Uncharacterized protein n=1 Tax=Daphnia magna TaxID=35525 RepID=A0ABQ9ZXF3_9CRUS|nr:hypothetical protein OUZ56_032794 [Daphnia magna]
MAENPPPSAASVKEKLNKSREREEECSNNFQLLRQDLLKARTAAIDVVLAHQKAIVKLDVELTHLGKPGILTCGREISESEDLMLRTNRERMELLFAQHRCFGCFLPLSVTGHLKMADCPHLRYCAMCGTTDHHQILCAPRRAYQGIIPE